MVSLPDLMPALPEIFLACAGMALLLIGVFLGEKSTRIVASLAVLSFLITGALLLMGPDGRVVTFGGMFVADGFAVFMKILVLIGSALALIMSLDYLEHEGMSRFEYPVLFVLATVGMLLMISANNLISLYLGLELQSLSLYVVAAFNRDSERSSEAGLKYFVLGALSSGLLLYGASLIYGFLGTTGFDALAQALSGQGASGGVLGGSSMGVIIGLVFVCAALAFKVSAVPFHMWTPDVYEGAPTPVTAFFAVAPKVAAMALFVRVLVEPFGQLTGQWQQIIVVASALSMILGAFAAIAQTNIKRLMAYSSIGHVGFALLGLAAGTQQGITGVIVYMAVYIPMSLGAFAVILSMRINGKQVEGIQDLAGLGKTSPGLAFALVVMMFSMAGIPPLAGFFAKLYVFKAVIEQGTTGFIILAVIGVLASVVSAVYYLKIIRVMYFDEPKVAFDKPEGAAIPAILAVSTLFIVVFWLLPAPLTGAAQAAAASLFGG
ncbi:NADH-quinone oxidoreductase subunit NuoN [Inquilinus sp. NPDC058860]|uniref:NADH-quinone oxidoreductase subunit NuoN n=1 Tax=Inquilinus sp. NPDC058860 TaxID=3346652 RepID=UPI0036A0D84E